MNTQIESLFAELTALNPEIQRESALVLGCLLERTLWPGRHDAEHQLFLSKEAVELKLDDEAEIEPFIQTLVDALESPNVSIDTKISLSTTLAKTGRVSCLTAILRLLKSEIETLDDRQAYGLIAPVLGRAPATLWKEYEATLNRLLARGNEHLNQPVSMALKAIHGN